MPGASPGPVFEIEAEVRARGFAVSLAVQPGETVAVLGPNGAGKSTLLTLIAGLLRPDAGHARLGERVLFDVGAQHRSRWLPPHARGVSMLAQDALLFPHLSALDNVAFGPRSQGSSRASANARAAEWLERVGAEDLASRKPAQLSGGQAQRIAVARALASEPDLLLLDEPMAALDVSVAPALRRMLREVLADRTAIIVTHDVLDAFTLADRVLVLEAGRVVEAGPTREVLDRPRTPFAAGLAALNLLVGVRDGDAVLTDGGHRIRVSGLAAPPTESALDLGAPPENPAPASAPPSVPGARVGVSVRPSRVSVELPDGSPASGSTPGSVTALHPHSHPAATSDPTRNVLRATITDLEPRGDLVRVRSAEIAADVEPGLVADLDLAPGREVVFSFPADAALAYPL
ncbi:ATP-binding cassette domain-containing protein [Herbiconiux sp.]|uniref:sulfate/molybdate ABC transporter ATP-binding protein n=1 Tax=Herbiconiux sp. TaxID=1871186 RepID=UPI0025BD2077|nr:ATP-binding cassette domain-containing protein [Herbiconiux sp.]